MKKYQEYKETGLDWLAEIPKHWDWLYLSQASSEQQIKNSNNQENNVLSLSYGNIINKKDINFGLVPKEYDTYQIVHNGNIILRLTDLQNDKKSLRTGLVTQTGIITSAYTCLKPKANSAYLHYLLHSFDTQKVFYGLGGGVRQSISYADIRNIRVSVPPKDEQDQIVKFLDYKISKINKFIKNKKKLIELLNEQKQAVINQELDTLIKNGAPKSRLSTHTKKIGSGKTPRGGSAVYITEGVLFIRSQNVYPHKIITESAYYISDEIDNSMASTRVYNGDVLLNITGGSIGRSAIFNLDIQANVNQHVCIIRTKIETLLPEFLCTILNSDYGQNLIKNSQNAGNRESLTFVQIGQFAIPLPKIDEQHNFLEFVQKKFISIDTIISKTQKEIDLIQEYKTSLISSVVTGQVDVRDVVVPNFTEEEFNDIDELIEEVEEGNRPCI